MVSWKHVRLAMMAAEGELAGTASDTSPPDAMSEEDLAT